MAVWVNTKQNVKTQLIKTLKNKTMYNKPKGAPALNLNKGYGNESSSQENKNLISDNPIAKHASGGTFMSQHSHSSPLGMYKKEM